MEPRSQVRDRLPPDVPLGYHHFVPDGGEPVLLIVSPGKCLLPPAGGHWCWALQLYAARSDASWGIGDLADLAVLGPLVGRPARAPACCSSTRWSAVAPRTPQQSSSTIPAAGGASATGHLRIEEVPGAAALGDELNALAAAGRALNQKPRIDRDAIFQLKQQAARAGCGGSSAATSGSNNIRRQQGSRTGAVCRLLRCSNEQLGPD